MSIGPADVRHLFDFSLMVITADRQWFLHLSGNIGFDTRAVEDKTRVFDNLGFPDLR
jgi:hypothetical protein